MGAAEGEAGERFRSWYFTREEIERGSPSRRDGIGPALEAELRVTYCCFIRDVCIRLRLPQITLATAILLCHRFYLRQSLARNEWQTIASVCVFLASKIEETPCHLRHVVIVAYETMYRKTPDAAKRIHQDDLIKKQKDLILAGETLLLSTIRFDFNIQHPYEPLMLALKNLGITQKEEVKQAAVKFINDTLPTTLALQFKPHYIAARSLFLAAKSHNIRLPSETGKVWWHQFEVNPKQLQAVLQQMMFLFQQKDSCSMGPDIKPTPIPTSMDEKQMISAPSPADIKPPPTPTLMGRQQITSTQGPAMKQAQSSNKRISNSYTVASRCLHVDSLSICSSARDEQNTTLRVHINHSLNIAAVDQRSAKQSSRGTLKGDHGYQVSTGSKDTRTTSIKDFTTQKIRRIQEIGGYPAVDITPDQGAWTGRQLRSVIVIETNSSWKRQKVERG